MHYYHASPAAIMGVLLSYDKMIVKNGILSSFKGHFEPESCLQDAVFPFYVIFCIGRRRFLSWQFYSPDKPLSRCR